MLPEFVKPSWTRYVVRRLFLFGTVPDRGLYQVLAYRVKCITPSDLIKRCLSPEPRIIVGRFKFKILLDFMAIVAALCHDLPCLIVVAFDL